MGTSRSPAKKQNITEIQVRKFAEITRIMLSVLIGMGLTGLFMTVVLATLVMAFTNTGEQATGLLNTALALVTTALGVVTGYVFGRNSNRR